MTLIIVGLSIYTGIFWDNITFVSAMGNALYNNGVLNWLSISNQIDPGHPPTLATLLAFFWKLLGKSLWISHLVILPFVYGLLLQLYNFVHHIVNHKRLSLFAFLLVLADPTLLAQLVTVNPEAIQLFFFFLSLNAVLNNNKTLKVIGLVGLSLVLYRGMMLGFGIFLIDILQHSYYHKQTLKSFLNKQNILVYILSSIPALIYILWRLVMKGWLISNPHQPWGNALDYSSESGFLWNFGRNIGMLVHRYIDFGRVSVIIFIIIVLIWFRNKISDKIKLLLFMAISSVVAIIITSLFINNPMGHRYFIPSYLLLSLTAFVLIEENISKVKTKSVLYAFLLISLISGNFFIYPDKISQGWDASLAHLPYWELRESAINYLDDNDIKINHTETFFPNNTSIDAVELNGDERTFLDFSGQEKYVLYSNVFNIKDSEYKTLKIEYDTLKIFKKRGVKVLILEKK
ncbi:hypothetical protein [Mesohalobacter halotolerans]|uniref:Glycosyltransferase RgtA/B/C/D-like domain-containing protein n=1 Tax=Mesohalobacter halotolerans TaxID=1883405 RepID=A0A4U5TRA4_9FLAO|nr:hypothetical protein [Mesohalobacter halotolerans]MBS3738739.1 hypothetical protein [Psychroflexus sp.]TKS56770.1 hypothetical protein FCN74_07015 [Mesohalobacter halotolerans]